MRQHFSETFDVPDGYLDTPTMGVPTLTTVETMHRAMDRWRRAGWRPGDFVDSVEAARGAFASLVGVDTDNVATGASVSSMVGLLASQVPAGARVLVARDEYTSVTFPFAAQAARGVTVTEVDLAALPSHAADHDIVAVSVVQSADGALLDLGRLRSAVEGTPCRVVLDVTQAAGWMPLELAWADAVIGAGYKWLLASRGVGWTALRPDYAENLIASFANWRSAREPGKSVYGLPLHLASGAKRFDISPAWFDLVCAGSVLPWIASLDIHAVHKHCVGLADCLREQLGLQPTGSAIVALSEPGAAERLRAAGVVAASRGGRTRLGFHLYNTMDDVDRVVAALSD